MHIRLLLNCMYIGLQYCRSQRPQQRLSYTL